MKRKHATFIYRIIHLLYFMSVMLAFCITLLLIMIYHQTDISFFYKIIFTAIILFLMTGYGMYLKKQIINPYLNYHRLFERFNDGRIYREFLDEAGSLFPGLNQIFTQYDKLLNRQNMIQKNKRQTEFIALQNQINPHFLYNTLEAIRGDALSAGMENIANTTEALATFFRYTITDTGSLVTIEDELENVDNYFQIQKYRFGEKLNIVYEVPDHEAEILLLQCPKLTMQPVVENAIFHGLEKKPEGGLVRIRIELAGSKVLIHIEDNGVGMKEDELEAINHRLENLTAAYLSEDKKGQKGGIALNNLCRRIKLLFGEEYGLHVYSMVGVGTQVCITLPIVKRELGFAYEGRINHN